MFYFIEICLINSYYYIVNVHFFFINNYSDLSINLLIYKCWKLFNHVFFSCVTDFLKKLNCWYFIFYSSLRTEDSLKTVSELPINRIMLETDCPWCEIKQTHSSYPFVQTKFNSVKKEKFVDGSMVKGRNEPSTIM